MVAGAVSVPIAAGHLLIIAIGEPPYRFFGGPGDPFADILAAGSFIPALVVLLLAGLFLTFILYAFSGAGIVPALPFLRIGLSAAAKIFLLRGPVNLPYWIRIILGQARCDSVGTLS